ncbi:hypothetical protein FRC01_000532 [Tulasnella sp. 417]|nr:hypothetical protein FRC01_000532 [Tulasnella sp. 417]
MGLPFRTTLGVVTSTSLPGEDLQPAPLTPSAPGRQPSSFPLASVAVLHHNSAGLSDRPISISTTVQVALNHVVADVGDAIANLNFCGPQLHLNGLYYWWRKCSDQLMNGMMMVFTCVLALLAESAPTFNPAEILAVAATTIHQPRPRPASINTVVQTLERLARPEPEAKEGGVQYGGNTWADRGCRHSRVRTTFGPPSDPRTASPEPESSVSDDNANVVEATLIPPPPALPSPRSTPPPPQAVS